MCGIHNSCDYEYSVKLACATNSLYLEHKTFETEKGVALQFVVFLFRE